MSIEDAIVAGERDAAVLAKRHPPHIKASEETIRKSLVGNWRAEHLFTLKQSRDWYRAYQQQIVACEEVIEQLLQQFEPWVDPNQEPLPPDGKPNRRSRKRRKQDSHRHL
jgi:hypothetical protein